MMLRLKNILARKKIRKKFILGFLFLSLLVGFYWARWWMFIAINKEYAAAYACRIHIKGVLNNPASAQFDDLRNADFEQIEKGYRTPTGHILEAYTVKLSVRSTNAFNAIVYKRIKCTLVLVQGKEQYGFVPHDIREE